MEIIKNRKEESTQEEEELRSLSEILSFCSEDDNKLNPLQEIFGAHSSSRPNDVTKNCEEEKDKKSHRTAKRQRSMEYRVVMEKKRRQLIREKVDILQKMTPNCAKSDLAAKLESIVEYIKSLKHQLDVMSMSYTSPFYGAQAPCMSPYATPWGYYTPGIPMMPHQNMHVIQQFHQVHDTAPPDQTQT